MEWVIKRIAKSNKAYVTNITPRSDTINALLSLLRRNSSVVVKLDLKRSRVIYDGSNRILNAAIR